jgi:hypothetical protein
MFKIYEKVTVFFRKTNQIHQHLQQMDEIKGKFIIKLSIYI